MSVWWAFALRRLAGLAAGVVFLVIASFAIVQLIPGDPARRIAGLTAPPEYVEQVRASLGIDRPVVDQFTDYVERVATLDFGTSFASDRPVGDILAERLPKTLALAGTAFLLTLAISTPLGLAAAAFFRDDRHRRAQWLFTAGTGTLAAVPEFLLATLLVFVFAVELTVLPIAGATGWRSLVLPVAAISLPAIAVLARIVLIRTQQVLRTDYIRAAEAKRLPPSQLYARHVLPNVLTAALTIGGLFFAGLLAGSVVVENVFARPGIGTTVVDAITARDYPVIQASILILGVGILIVNAVIDLILALVDPRSIERQR